jgi:hypothetical protein
VGGTEWVALGTRWLDVVGAGRVVDPRDVLSSVVVGGGAVVVAAGANLSRMRFDVSESWNRLVFLGGQL